MRRFLLSVVALSFLSALVGCKCVTTHGVCDCVADDHCSTRQPWINQLDLGVQQELPGFFNGNKFVVRLDVYNFLNMLNKDWGTQEGLGYFATRRLANISDVNAAGQYVYDLGTPTSPSWQKYGTYDSIGTPPSRVSSRWSAVLTLKYQF